ncbi:septum formation initiator family protein [Streptomyces sp. CNQ085]|uniref:FtsB family cell division protein n=1 Tax=Streptomyces sp. CNQ085 TaxID=2886944 RepID=UPI001F50485E|nr:septum formation initiator family protein [Streptomyces sp. CNQ085]MCI0386608.1 septum formation initiator family protein [Streptomyces sp. CNQ085]
MAAERERFSTATRLRALGTQAAERVYRAQNRRMRAPRRSRLTGRAALLVLVLCSLVVALAYPMRQYVSQRAEIEEQRGLVEELRGRVEDKRDLKVRWKDPAYVERMIREHLLYVRPGETGYILSSGTADRTGGSASRSRRGAGPGPTEQVWFRYLWDGLDTADASGAAGQRP